MKALARPEVAREPGGRATSGIRNHVTVRHLVAGSVVEESHTAERITTQQSRGILQVRLWSGDRLLSLIVYRRAEWFRLDFISDSF